MSKDRSLSLFNLYDKTQQDLGLKVYHTLGNHDCVGVYPQSGITPIDPLYGKAFYNDHIGKTYYSFDHKGVHFIVLDTIGLTPDRAYEGRIDAAQLAWLRNDLARQSREQPVIVSAHIPLVSAVENYLPMPATPPAHHGITVTNSSEVTKLFEGHNVLAVLQGHTHQRARGVAWRPLQHQRGGVRHWWKGTRLGTPEGFTVVYLRQGKLTTRYETYGFHTVAPENT